MSGLTEGGGKAIPACNLNTICRPIYPDIFLLCCGPVISGHRHKTSNTGKVSPSSIRIWMKLRTAQMRFCTAETGLSFFRGSIGNLERMQLMVHITKLIGSKRGVEAGWLYVIKQFR